MDSVLAEGIEAVSGYLTFSCYMRALFALGGDFCSTRGCCGGPGVEMLQSPGR